MSIETGNGPSPQSELSIDELTVPENWEDLGLWMESLIGFQLEEAEKGIQPQIMSGLIPRELLELWKREVWGTYWSSFHARYGSF